MLKNWKVLWAIISILVVVIGVLSFSLLKPETPTVDSFETCVAAGYPVVEIYPRQCMTPERSFTENVPLPTEPPLLDDSNNTACTMEARQCPDGSWVGRTGPNCEFTPCPGE